MKTITKLFYSLLLLSVFACSTDDGSEEMLQEPTENPTSFQLLGNVESQAYAASISWSASEDPQGGEIFYRIYLNGELIEDNYSLTNYTFQSLEPSTNYQVTIEAVDEDENTTAINFSFTTQNFEPTQFELINQIDFFTERKLSSAFTHVLRQTDGYIVVGHGNKVINEGQITTSNNYLGIIKINLNGDILWERYHESAPYPVNNSTTSFFTREYKVNDTHIDANGNIVAVGRSFTYRQLNNGNPSNTFRKYCPFVMTLDANTGDMINLEITALTLMPDAYEDFTAYGYNSFVNFDGGRVFETTHGKIIKYNASNQQEWSIDTYASINESNDDLRIKDNLIYYIDSDKIKTVDASGNTTTVLEATNYFIRRFNFSEEGGIYYTYFTGGNSMDRLVYFNNNQIVNGQNIVSIEGILPTGNDVIVAHFPFGNGNRMVEKRDRNLEFLYENESFTIPSEINIELLKIAPNQFVKFGTTNSSQTWIRMTHFKETE